MNSTDGTVLTMYLPRPFPLETQTFNRVHPGENNIECSY